MDGKCNIHGVTEKYNILNRNPEEKRPLRNLSIHSLLQLRRFRSNFNAVRRSVKDNMAYTCVVLMESDGDCLLTC